MNHNYDTIPEQLYKMHAKGELSKTDYEIGTAVWVADNLRKFPILVYPPLPEHLRIYIHRRMQGLQEYTSDISRQLGSWLQEMQKRVMENESNFSFVIWCTEKCLSVNLTAKVESLSAYSKRMGEHMLPIKELQTGHLVLKMDCDARRSKL